MYSAVAENHTGLGRLSVATAKNAQQDEASRSDGVSNAEL